ncbi:cellulose-binding domain-containing protein, partial [Streptomyces sp. TRM76130]|nr:cellulose-binding domain-containing protein [Streptomyces sp. TRM76130]
GWTLGFTFPSGQTITNMWGGTPTQSGSSVTVTAASYTSAIPTGGSVTVGFTGTKLSTNAAPTGFTLNGTNCSAG